jgi:hypothetical protein
MGTWAFAGTPETLEFNFRGQNTSHWRVLYISKNYQCLDVEKMGSHEPFGHLQHKLCQKERPGVKLLVWLPTIKSWELTWPWCVQVECDTSLESSWQGLELCFGPHCDWSFAQKVMRPQSRGSLGCWNFRTKNHLNVTLWRVAEYTIWRKVVPSLEFGPWWVLWVQSRLWLVLALQVF